MAFMEYTYTELHSILADVFLYVRCADSALSFARSKYLLLHVFSDISVSSVTSPCEGFHTLMVVVLGVLKLSLDEFTEFILGFITMVVQGLLSFHHLERLGNFLLQHLQQQQ
jgi:hypothetical protein